MLDYTGLTLDEVMAADFRARVYHPDDVERLHDERQEALARGTPFANEQRARRHDGQYRWRLIQYNPLRDEQGQILRWYATGTDIDERKQAEERMRHENLALREDIDRASMFEEIVGSSAALRQGAGAGRESGCRRIPPCSSWVRPERAKELIARAIHQAVEPRGAGLYPGELRGHSARADRLRIVRARERRLHRGAAAAAGAF